MSERRYSDRDVAFILKRAVALDDEKVAVETRHGITLPDLREIAQDVGIDPAMVDQAAEELNRQGSRTARAVATETAVVKEIRSVPRSLDDANVRDVLLTIDRATSDAGSVSEVAGEIQWTSTGPFRSMRVSIKALEEETILSVEESLRDTKEPLLALPAIFGGILGLFLGADGGGAGTALMVGMLMAIAGFFVGGGLWQLVLDHHIQRARSLMDEAVRAVQGRFPSRPATDLRRTEPDPMLPPG
jgi:DNA-binding transcriptional regulator YhcF (GntR family)